MHSSRNSTRKGLLLVSSLALAVTASNAVAGGFEKATLWDAQYSALAGAAVSSVDDSSAIFFNPAGLAFAETNDIAIHLSPTVTQAWGPATGVEGETIEGEKNFSPAGGFTGLYKLNDKFTLGYGIYATGGAAASYEDITVGEDTSTGGPFDVPLTTALTGDYSTEISIVEAGLGLGYRINNNWSVGATYRLTYAYADINMASATGPVGALIGYNDMEGWNTFGVRLGTMYRSDDERWGWGLNYRSEVKVEADGTNTNTVGLGEGAPGSEYDATAKTGLPMQISTGAHYKLTPEWTVFGEVTYTEYSANDVMEFISDDPEQLVTHIYTNWEDQYNYRIAAEYTGIEGWALRGGYIYTTAVVPEEYAAPTFSTPAVAHTFTLGAGTTFMDDKIELDMAAEYNTVTNDDVEGTGTVTNTGSKSVPGEYKTRAYAVHMTLKYNF